MLQLSGPAARYGATPAGGHVAGLPFQGKPSVCRLCCAAKEALLRIP